MAIADEDRGTGRRDRPWYTSRKLDAGLAIVGLVVLTAILAPLIQRYNPQAQDTAHILSGPSSAHWLGTDELGRDIWSRLVWGARTDLRIAFLAVLLPFTTGTLLGCLAGYRGGWVDGVIMRVVDVVFAFPFYVLIIALVFSLGPGTTSIFIAIAAISWVAYARIVRGGILVAKRQDYVAAAVVGGLSGTRVVVRHILPNVIPQAVIYAMSDIVLDILAIVTLGYLGLGVAPPTPDWGSMIFDGQSLLTTHWQIATIPGLAIVVVGIGLALIGDGLADRFRVE